MEEFLNIVPPGPEWASIRKTAEELELLQDKYYDTLTRLMFIAAQKGWDVEIQAPRNHNLQGKDWVIVLSKDDGRAKAFYFGTGPTFRDALVQVAKDLFHAAIS